MDNWLITFQEMLETGEVIKIGITSDGRPIYKQK